MSIVLLLGCDRAASNKPPATKAATTTSEALGTSNSGAAYIAECAAAGVPVPTNVLDSQWEKRGYIREFITDYLFAELWTWTSTNPAGICLSLPRWTAAAAPRTATFLGVICQGVVSGKVCFWDNSHVPGSKWNPDDTAAGNVGYPLSSFKGGAELNDPGQVGTGGMCTDCHAGSNAFIVHPDDGPFVPLLELGSPLLDLMYPALGWYEPIVHGSWPQNERREHRLSTVELGENDLACTNCHNAEERTELPEVHSGMQYCTAVLDTAVRTSSPEGTMPAGPYPVDFATSAPAYAKHRAALQGYCDLPPPVTGVVVAVEPGMDDITHISPPSFIRPIYTCAKAVGVTAVIPGATVRLHVTNTRTGAVASYAQVAGVRDTVSFSLPAGLDEDEVLDATQELGVISAADHVEVGDYPSSTLPAPVFAPATIHECANTISVKGVNGSTLSSTHNAHPPSVGWYEDGWGVMSPGMPWWRQGDYFTVAASLSCISNGVLRTWSSPTTPVPPAQVLAGPRPASLLKPTWEPAQTYEGQRYLGLRGFTFGSFARLSLSSVTPTLALGDTGPSPHGWGWNFDAFHPLGNRLILPGDSFAADPMMYCPGGPAGPSSSTPPARPCSDLPAPRIAAPTVGDQAVAVVSSLPRARLRVWDSSTPRQEIGDGAAPVVKLKRPVTASDVLRVIQSVDGCSGASAYQVGVLVGGGD